MAQLTEPMFSINGTPLKQFSMFTLEQSLFEHHHFKLICPAQAIDGKTGMFSKSREMIGGSFGARISGVGLEGTVLFNGIITGIETARFTGHHGDVIITGHSPTIVLDSGPHCKSWEKKAVKNIANDVLKFFPQNLLEPKVQPLYAETLAYTVQYKETAWQFLKRLTSTYGEWLFWDGRSLVVGPPRDNKKTELVYGRHLSNFNVSLQTRPTNMQLLAWDYLHSRVYTSEPQAVAQKAGLNPWGEQVYKATQTVYGTQPKQWNNRFLTNKKQQDDVTTLKSAIESSKLIRFNGQSGHPGVAIGTRIEVSGNNVFTEDTEGYGEYLITSITHKVDSIGNYENAFTAVPSSIKVPPVEVPADPACETQSAIVTDNNDFNGLGRVRVKFHWMNGAEKTPWVRVTSPHGGGEKGHFFIPEVGEEVIVGFESDSPTKPYVIGAVYHSSANTSFSNEGNDIKTIQTRSGTKIRMNDAEGSVFVEDPSGNTWFMDGKGNISVNAPKNFTVNAGEHVMITAGKDVSVSAGNNISHAANDNITSVAGTDIIQTASGDIRESSDTRTEIAEKEIKRQSETSNSLADKIDLFSQKENMTLQSGGIIEQNSSGKVKLF